MSEPEIIEREPLAVQFVRAAGIAGIGAAWEALEAAVGDLHGRHFYGAFYPASGEYRACVEVRDEDALVPGLEEGSLPGGPYLRTRLKGEPPELYERIPATFDLLAQDADGDASRPSLEHYRRRDEVDLLLPVR